MKFKNRPAIFNGIKFDSQLELKGYRYLKMLKVPFKFHTKTFTLSKGYTIEDFSQKTKKLYTASVRPITYTPEFEIKCPNGIILYIEMKGQRTESFNLKWKMCRKQLKKHERAIIIKNIADLDRILDLYHVPKNVKQMKINLEL